MKWIKPTEDEIKDAAKEFASTPININIHEQGVYQSGVRVGFKHGANWVLSSLPTPPSDSTMEEAVKEQFILRSIDTNKWYWCKCENCGWEDSSEFCEGGHAIADTGDYSDPLCPICFSNKIEGEPTLDVPDNEGIAVIKIPLELYIAPYKKIIKQALESKDKRHWEGISISGFNKSTEEINIEFRMIISHALLGSDTDNVSRETWELVFSECTKYAMSLSGITANTKQGSSELVEYWKQRCVAAEIFIKESPCDPDITKNQIAAYNKWQELNKQYPPHEQGTGEWIDCNERQPELGDSYNVVWDLEDGEPPTVTTMEWDAIGKRWRDVMGTPETDQIVLFWQPLPFPPQSVKE